MAVSLEEVVRTLQNRIGARWEGMEGDGRDEMIRVIKKDFDLGTSEANDIIDSLIRTGTLRYEHQNSNEGEAEVDRSADNDDVLPILPIGVGTSGSGSGAATGGLGIGGLAVPLGAAGGYWRIGNESDLGV